MYTHIPKEIKPIGFMLCQDIQDYAKHSIGTHLGKNLKVDI